MIGALCVLAVLAWAVGQAFVLTFVIQHCSTTWTVVAACVAFVLTSLIALVTAPSRWM